MPAVIVRQRKPYRRKDGVVLYFEGRCSMCSVLCYQSWSLPNILTHCRQCWSNSE